MPALIATITGNWKPLKITLQDVENAARRAGMVVDKNLNQPGGGGGVHGVRAGVMRESLVLLREIGRGNWSRVPGSLSILMSQLQLLPILFNPATIAIVAFGAAAFFAVRRLLTLKEEERNLADLMDLTRTKFSERSAAMKKAAEAAQEMADWTRELRRAELGLSDALEETLKRLRERAKFQKELATNKGAGKKTLAEMDIDELKKEIQVMEQAQKAAQRRVSADSDLANRASKRANDVDRQLKLQKATASAETMGKIIDKIQEKMRNGKGLPLGGFSGRLAGGSAPSGLIKNEMALPSHMFEVEVEGRKYRMSLIEARKQHEVLAKAEAALAAKQKELADLVAKFKKSGEKDAAEEARINKEIRDAKRDLALKQKFLPQLADSSRTAIHGALTTLQQQGAYTAPAALIDVNKKMEHHLKKIEGHLSKAQRGGAYTPRAFGGVRH